MSKLKNIPDFQDDNEERAFWAESDSADYIDWRPAKPVFFSKLKPSTKTSSLRLPEFLLEELRMMAKKGIFLTNHL